MATLDEINEMTLRGARTEALGQAAGGFAQLATALGRSTVLRQDSVLKRESAERAREAGQDQFARIKEETAQLIGRQKVALAANGIVVGRDTALDLVTETAGIGALDALTALDNAEELARQRIIEANRAKVSASLEKQAGFQRLFGALGDAGRTLNEADITIQRRTEDFS